MEVKAILKYIRVSPQKARLTVDTIRGKKVSDALDILNYSKDEYNSKTNNRNKYVMNNSDKLPTDVVLKNMISNLINNKC